MVLYSRRFTLSVTLGCLAALAPREGGRRRWGGAQAGRGEGAGGEGAQVGRGVAGWGGGRGVRSDRDNTVYFKL